MLTTEQINELHRLYWSERWPIRKIERHLRMGWRTIQKYLEQPAQTPLPRQRTSKCGFRCNWSSDSGGNWSAIPVGSGPGFRWEVVQFLKVYRNGGPLAGMLDHMTGTVDQITGIGQM